MANKISAEKSKFRSSMIHMQAASLPLALLATLFLLESLQKIGDNTRNLSRLRKIETNSSCHIYLWKARGKNTEDLSKKRGKNTEDMNNSIDG